MSTSEIAASRELSPVDPLIEAKFRTGYGVVMEKLGSMNQAYAAGVLYDSIFLPDTVVERHGIAASDQFLDRMDVLQAKVPVAAVPERGEFVEKIRDALTREVDHEACLYPDAWDVVDTMMRTGPTAIWTQGDVAGYGTDETPGSYEQIKKVGLSPIPAMRREVHKLWLGRLAAGYDEPPSNLNDILTLVAGEDKFSVQALERLNFYFRSQGVSQIVIIEDRLANLQRLQRILKADDGDYAPGFKVCGVWVRQGKYGRAEPTGDMRSIIEVPTLEHVPPIVRAVDDGTGFISDYDGVLSNQSKRLELQAAAVQDVLVRNNWI